MKKINLAIVRQKYRSDGGAERFIERALQSIEKTTNLDISIITRKWSGEKSKKIKEIICNPTYISRIGREASFSREASRLFHQFDLVQSHERIPGCHIYRAGDGVHKEWLRHKKRISSPLHKLGINLSLFHNYICNQEKKTFEDKNLKAVICNSKLIKNEILKNFNIPEEIIHVIYNSIDKKHFNPSECEKHRETTRAKLNIPKNATTFIFVGSGFERKGLSSAIAAIGKTKDNHLIVVGKDKNTKKYKKQTIKNSCAERVHFIGHTSDPRPYYGASDLLLLPTIYDPFPNVILEAFASGLGVITSNTCGGKDIIEDGINGFIIDAFSIDSICNAINKIDKKTIEKLKKNSVKTIEKMTPEELNNNLSNLYYSLTK